MANGADPIPGAGDCNEFYQLEVRKYRSNIRFSINDRIIFEFDDDGSLFGELLTSGKIGFRQLAPLTAEYRNLKVYELC